MSGQGKSELIDQKGQPIGRLATLASGDILGTVAAVSNNLGLAGETNSIYLLYLAMTSRLLKRPIHTVIKAPSASGKSFLVNTVAKLFPEDSYYSLSSVSPKVLFRPNLNLQHRVLIIQEVVWSRELDYVLRTLLSEGRLEYPTVVGGKAVILKNDGPVAFVTSTTKLELDPELETRLNTIPLSSSATQTKAILLRIAEGQRELDTNFSTSTFKDDGPFLLKKLQAWLQEHSTHIVDIPFATKLASLTPTDNIRVRRDFGQLLSLIRAHALLYQATRKEDSEGHLIATTADYKAIYDLLVGVSGQKGEAAKVKWQVDVLSAIKSLGQKSGHGGECNLSDVAGELGWVLSTTHRRVSALLRAGYLGSKGNGQGAAARLYIRAELGADWLPNPKAVAKSAKVLTRKRKGKGKKRKMP